MKKQTIKPSQATHDAYIENLSTYSLCRWNALKDAVDLIGDKCEDRGIDFDKFQELKPLDILNYVDSITDVLYQRAQESPEEAKQIYEKA